MQMQPQQLQRIEDFFARQYESSRHYTNAVVGSGYAVFFATWAFTREFLSPVIELSSALLILFSAASFIGWEVFRNVRNVLAFRELGDALTQEHPSQMGRRLVEYGRARQRSDLKSLKWWGITASVSIVTAAIALFLLGGSLAVNLVTTVGTHVSTVLPTVVL